MTTATSALGTRFARADATEDKIMRAATGQVAEAAA